MVEMSEIGGTSQSKRGRIGEKIISQSYPDDWSSNIWSLLELLNSLWSK